MTSERSDDPAVTQIGNFMNSFMIASFALQP